MRKLTVLVFVAMLSLAVAGCGDSDDGSGPLPATDTEQTQGAAGGTTMRVHTVGEALETEDPNPLHVSGLLLNDGSGWRLCDAVLESMPPQCGDPALGVVGVDEAEFGFEEAAGVRWYEDATVVGNVEGDTLTVTGSAASS